MTDLSKLAEAQRLLDGYKAAVGGGTLPGTTATYEVLIATCALVELLIKALDPAGRRYDKPYAEKLEDG